ncbi:unnamed protein product [Cylindrotheca closterium]|uniref:Uncharacterized protein n=1 Tax=Cylindrotheca closterium TaxID=2856 RepID=A0AAD2FPA5_9STRA|nr:unnamed protein product [Cylindrotheca closterium]
MSQTYSHLIVVPSDLVDHSEFTKPNRDTFLGKYTSDGGKNYQTLQEAQQACLVSDEASGITKERKNTYTLRLSNRLQGSPNGEISWLKRSSAPDGYADPEEPLENNTGAPSDFHPPIFIPESAMNKLPKWYKDSNLPGNGMRSKLDQDRWDSIDRVFSSLVAGDTHGTHGRYLTSKAKIIEMGGGFANLNDDIARWNKRGIGAEALMNYEAWFGSLSPDDLGKAFGYHPAYIARYTGNGNFEQHVLFADRYENSCKLVLELEEELPVQEVGWTFTPWDRNNCTSFQVTTMDATGSKSSWASVDVPRSTAVQVIQSVQAKTGFDLTPAIGEIEPAVRSSRDVYKAALNKTTREGADSFTKVSTMDGYTNPKDPEMLLQPTNSYDELYEDAAHAQRFVKEVVAPNTDWSRTELNEEWKQNYDEEHGEGAHRNFQAIKSSDGLIQGLQTVVDPGLKSKERSMAKALYKYKRPDGTVRWRRLRDLSRLAVEFEDAPSLLKGMEVIEGSFEVLQCENRFRQPTALGWRDISFLLKVPVPTPRQWHITEVQCYLKDFADARSMAHGYYETIRSKLPDICSIPINQLDNVQYIVNEELVEGYQVHRGEGQEGKHTISTTMARRGTPTPTRTIEIDFEDTGNGGYGGQRIVFLHVLGPSSGH